MRWIKKHGLKPSCLLEGSSLILRGMKWIWNTRYQLFLSSYLSLSLSLVDRLGREFGVRWVWPVNESRRGKYMCLLSTSPSSLHRRLNTVSLTMVFKYLISLIWKSQFCNCIVFPGSFPVCPGLQFEEKRML